ncbi:MAG: PilZ domain-containing protein [Candidatus Omnitrophota bacterium]
MMNVLYITVIGFLMVVLYLTKREEKLSRPKSQYPLEEYWKGAERRSFTRFPKTLQIDYVYLPHDGRQAESGKNKKGLSQDVSWGGLQLLLPEKFNKGTRLSLEIRLEEGRSPVRAVAEVVWMDEARDHPQSDGARVFRTGMKFVNFTSDAQDRLVKFLYEGPPL